LGVLLGVAVRPTGSQLLEEFQYTFRAFAAKQLRHLLRSLGGRPRGEIHSTFRLFCCVVWPAPVKPAARLQQECLTFWIERPLGVTAVRPNRRAAVCEESST